MKVLSCFILSMLAALFFVAPGQEASAKEPVRGIEAMPDRAQFLIIIDDSASMDYKLNPPHSIPSDPNRLAVLAAKSFIYLLSENDQIAIVGMNQLADLDLQKPEMVQLHDRKSALAFSQSSLKENSRDKNQLASYLGKQTPCKDALDRAQVVLNHWYTQNSHRDKTRQILMFMTDGRCESNVGISQEPIDAADWKKGIQSQEKLQFFLVRFEKTKDVEKLDTFADRRMVINQDAASQLKSMVESFARVFSFARGYSLEEQNRKFPKAVKVHILAFRQKPEKPGEKLTVELRDGQGKNNHPTLRLENSEALQFTPEGNNKTNKYEYLAASFIPDGSDFKIWVPSGTSHIIVPDYHSLETKTFVNKGRCGVALSMMEAEKQKTLDIDMGTQFCVRVGLRSSKGYLNPKEDLDFISYFGDSPCDCEGDSNVLSGQAGDKEEERRIEGKVVIGKTEKFEIPAKPWTLSVQLKQISAEIAGGADLTNIRAGEKRTFKVRFNGKFRPDLKLAFDTHSADPCLVRFGLDEDRRTTRSNDKGVQQEEFTVNPGMERQFVIETRRCRGGHAFSGRVTFEILSEGVNLPNPSIDLQYRIQQTSFWDYYGALIIKILIGLFLFSVLVCFIRGWMMPMRIPKNKDFWFFYANRENVEKADPAFANPTDQFGAKPMRTKLRDSFGWYRNPFVAINSRISWLGPEFALEYCSIGNKEGFYVVQKSGFQLASVNIADLQDSEHAFQAIDFYTPRPTISAFFLCRLYARIFGRLRSVRFSKRMIETGRWYRISSGETEFFFKIGSDPNTLSEDI